MLFMKTELFVTTLFLLLSFVATAQNSPSCDSVVARVAFENTSAGELPEALSGKVGFHSCSAPSRGTSTAVPIFHFPVL